MFFDVVVLRVIFDQILLSRGHLWRPTPGSLLLLTAHSQISWPISFIASPFMAADCSFILSRSRPVIRPAATISDVTLI